jgi:hypothetical protein
MSYSLKPLLTKQKNNNQPGGGEEGDDELGPAGAQQVLELGVVRNFLNNHLGGLSAAFYSTIWDDSK